MRSMRLSLTGQGLCYISDRERLMAGTRLPRLPVRMFVALSCIMRLHRYAQATCTAHPAAQKIDQFDQCLDTGLLCILHHKVESAATTFQEKGLVGNRRVSDALPNQVVSQILYNQCAVCRADTLRVDAYYHG